MEQRVEWLRIRRERDRVRCTVQTAEERALLHVTLKYASYARPLNVQHLLNAESEGTMCLVYGTLNLVQYGI